MESGQYLIPLIGTTIDTAEPAECLQAYEDVEAVCVVPREKPARRSPFGQRTIPGKAS